MKTSNRSSDLKAASKMTTDAIVGITSIVEGMHRSIETVGGTLSSSERSQPSGITGFVYRTVKKSTSLVGLGLEHFFDRLEPYVQNQPSTPVREAFLSGLNGVLGDYLDATENSFALPMIWRKNGAQWNVEMLPPDTKHVLIVLHGLCMNDLQWTQKEHNHAELLSERFNLYPIYLRYNSGKHISENGEFLNELLESTFSSIAENTNITFLVHSMGGLVLRSAYHYGKERESSWTKRVEAMYFLGTPHTGAFLEQSGNGIDWLLGSTPFSAPLARLGKIRSAGITDMRFGTLLTSDWEYQDRFETFAEKPTWIPLPTQVSCYTIAATISNEDKPSTFQNRFIGDGLVPLSSALGDGKLSSRQLAFEHSRTIIARNHNHMELLHSQEVYRKLEAWMETQYSINGKV